MVKRLQKTSPVLMGPYREIPGWFTTTQVGSSLKRERRFLLQERRFGTTLTVSPNRKLYLRAVVNMGKSGGGTKTVRELARIFMLKECSKGHQYNGMTEIP